MFEIKHLKTLITLAETGNIRKAAEVLFTSQSALSHQIKDLETRLSTTLFVRNTAPVEFTEAGGILLKLAKEVLPAIEQAKRKLTKPNQGTQTLRLGIACHACFQWLLPVTTTFALQDSLLTVEFVDQDFIQTKQSQVDILFTDEKDNDEGYLYQEIGQFEVVAVCAKNAAITKQAIAVEPSTEKEKALQLNYIEPESFANATLLTYPLPIEQLDIFNLFLKKTTVRPDKIKPVSNSHVMLQMVAANMGVATLPDWLVSSLTQQSLVQCLRLGKKGVYKTLYAKYQAKGTQLKTVEALIPKAIQAFINLYTPL